MYNDFNIWFMILKTAARKILPAVVCTISPNYTFVFNINQLPPLVPSIPNCLRNMAVGTLMPNAETPKMPTTNRPTIQAIISENIGSSESRAMPKLIGTGTKKTSQPAGRSVLTGKKKIPQSKNN